ncbi:NAD(P)/FAD-dependent oxidoreductase [Nocardioides dongxiaopingii]|uniref:NAD(P)/FAD-dependent oxidoreductase n=1 Tax=Nocardioides sp. S-1144 TaxID=2582905 RepID=UPI00110D3939|nr:NAD(P)/FAD-dependent oxidoreductase [Nocardioides sp. S-1144]QCW52229.1 NAD(P)/FAD-dependent oxidoreductase [Nocardioides sp. S-1144]
MSTPTTTPASTRPTTGPGATTDHPARHDVVVVGGGPAGLQAALTLGRMHRRVLVLDAGGYRNDPADLMHNFLTHDGRPPAEFRALGRAELATYDTVEVRDLAATSVVPDGDGFLVGTDAGNVATRLVVLATGVRDTLPDKPGLEELFGTVAAHCPFCHGHEYAGRPVAVLGSHAHVGRVAAMLAPIASELVVLTDGGDLDAENAAQLAGLGAAVRTEPVSGFCRSSLGARVSFGSGSDVEVGGVLVATAFEQSAPFAADLGLTLLGSGCVEVDEMGRTSLPGVFAAGDLAHLATLPMPMSSVLGSAAAGQLAAVACVGELIARDAGVLVPA